MSRSEFDRLRARRPVVDTAAVPAVAPDIEGKRALFSSGSPDADLTLAGATGAVSIECGRCGERTALSLAAAARAAFPSLVLSVDVGYGTRESRLGLLRRRNGVFLRCPACHRGAWSRLTVHL